MVSAPDRPMKSSSTMREAANKLVTQDLPLYMACPCRLTKPPVAQLTRLHIVTPKAPVWITLNPQVQPSPGGPVFVTGWDVPHRLAINSYWVLRLPSVYCGEGGAHLPPTTPPAPDSPCGTLLHGTLGLDEDWTES
jgi:protein SMG8